MNVNLTPELEALVQSKVASGLYNNQSEVVREALRLLEEVVAEVRRALRRRRRKSGTRTVSDALWPTSRCGSASRSRSGSSPIWSAPRTGLSFGQAPLVEQARVSFAESERWDCRTGSLER